MADPPRLSIEQEDIYAAPDRKLSSAVHNQRDKVRAYHLPLKHGLLQQTATYHQGAVPPFTDLRECSVEFEKFFDNAWKAIERGSMKKLKDSVRLMKMAYSLSGKYLDVCYLQTTVSQISEKVVVYYMTLLAHAAVHQRLEMVKFLIKEGASLHTDNVLTGTPLTQLFVFSMLHGCHDIISCEVVKILVSPAALTSIVYYDIPVNEFDLSGEATSFWIASPLSFAILLQRFDVAALLTEQGADPLLDLGDGTPTCMVEYLHFGTNKFFSWLFQEHLLTDKIAKFVEQLLPELPNILSEECIQMFNDYYKHPAHALLTCRSEEVIKTVLEDDIALLSVKDPNGKTALQIAAGQGDVVSIKLLLKMSRNENNLDMNMKEALLAAAKNDHTEIVSCLLQRDFSLGAQIVEDLTTSKHHTTDLSLLSSIFETFRDYKQELLLHKIDTEDNTIAHVAARSGNSKLFEVTFPLKSLRMMFDALRKKNKDGNTPIHLAIENGYLNILKALKAFGVDRRHKQGAEQKKEEREWKELWEGLGSDLLLHAGSHGSNEAVQILFDLTQDCNLHFDDVWKEALSEATKTGKRDMVRYLLNSEDISKNLSTEDVSNALLLAASNGNTRCVELLLQNKIKVDVQLKCPRDECNCLMKAIEGNHRETVLTIVSDAKYGFESLQVCRHTKPEDFTTPMRMLIVHMPDVAEWVLNACAIEDNKSQCSYDEQDVEGTQADTYEFLQELCYMNHGCVGPLVIENKSHKDDDMYQAVPLAELRTSEAKQQQSTMANSPANVDVKPTTKCCTSSNHPLKLMVKHDREALLHHPLVKKYIRYKWITVGIVGLVFYFALYLIFLSLLTTFALLVPRPSAANGFCSAQAIVSNNTIDMAQMGTFQDCGMPTTFSEVGSGATAAMKDDENGTVTTLNTTVPADDTTNTTEMSTIQGFCAVLLGNETTYLLRSISVILMVFSGLYLFLEVLQLYHRRKHYLIEFENYIQVLMYSLTIVFVSWPHGLPVWSTECWCFPSWRWQIGAVALFLAWFNCCFLLKDWPLVGQPVTMLIHVYFNFFTLVYLPILLILTFGFPLYMIHAQEGEDVTFANPARAIWNIILQTTGELDNTVKANTDFIYPVLTYTLLILFIIAMPLLFNNFLIGMAVGETEEERKKASLTLIKMKVRYTFEVESAIRFLRLKNFCPCCHKLWYKVVKACMKSPLDPLKLDRLEKENKRVIAQMKSKYSAEDSQAELNALRREMKSLKLLISDK